MYASINEPIQVGVVFKNGQIVPRVFLWQGKKFKVENLDMVHNGKVGSAKIYYFSVSNKMGAYKISFNNQTLVWRLEQVYEE